MKYIFCVLVLFWIGDTFAQAQPDTSHLAVFGKLSPAQLRLADSLLVSAVAHYNVKVSERPRLYMLDETEYLASQQLEAAQRTIASYVNNKGKTRELKLLFTPRAKRIAVRKLIAAQDSISGSLSQLEQTDRDRRDSIVSSWGSGDEISLPDYYRQYQVFTSPSGKTSIRAACICSDMMRALLKPDTKDLWKTRMITVYDGGSCYFTISLDLEKPEAKQMRVN